MSPQQQYERLRRYMKDFKAAFENAWKAAGKPDHAQAIEVLARPGDNEQQAMLLSLPFLLDQLVPHAKPPAGLKVGDLRKDIETMDRAGFVHDPEKLDLFLLWQRLELLHSWVRYTFIRPIISSLTEERQRDFMSPADMTPTVQQWMAEHENLLGKEWFLAIRKLKDADDKAQEDFIHKVQEIEKTGKATSHKYYQFPLLASRYLFESDMRYLAQELLVRLRRRARLLAWRWFGSYITQTKREWIIGSGSFNVSAGVGLHHI